MKISNVITEEKKSKKDITFPALMYYPYSKIIALMVSIDEDKCMAGIIIDPGISALQFGQFKKDFKSLNEGTCCWELYDGKVSLTLSNEE